MIDYTTSTHTTSKTYDKGLRQFMLKVYNLMAVALLLTGSAAIFTISWTPLANLMFNTACGSIIAFVPLAIALYFFFGFSKLSIQSAQALFWIYAVLVGMSLSYLFLIYTTISIARTFFICASVFGTMSLYGYNTNKDLTSWGSFFLMGLVGLLLTSLVNLFLQSSAVYFAYSFLGVIIFIGLIAWDTQKIKSFYFINTDNNLAQKMSIVAAFNLYLDFINLFLHLIRFLGKSRRQQ
ncbi:MAG: Bax inhibitor-1/YccA family protein [Rickettsia endosymbiont of Bryobia graminum]|nr:Bax inhibitor-1/YccA family protein [Rickettsia endosymbiont of Bryobia graminum]